MKLSNYIIPTLLLLAIAVVSCELRDDGNRVADITLEQTSATLNIGENLQLSAVLTPADVANPSIIWSSSNTGVATVLNGVVTAVSDGTATITATTQDGGHTATIAVTVSAPALPPPTDPDPAIPVTGITVSPTTAELTIGGTQQLTATVLPSNATNQNVTWESNDNSIATVDSDGLVTAVAEGSAIIIVTTVDGGYTAYSEITVVVATDPDISVTGVTVSPTTATLYVGDTEQLIATVLPSNATNQNVTWESNDNSIATVDSDGLVTAVAEGSATITATTVDGGYTAYSEITVVVATDPDVPVTGVTVSPTTATLYVGNTEQLTATVLPSNATNQNVTWSSNNTAVATVNSNTGLVSAVSAGSATITATTVDGGHTATSTVTVAPISATGVTLDPPTATLFVGNRVQLIATILPTNAANQSVSWNSNNTAVTTVNSNGLVTAIALGSATITVTTEDGGHTATSIITVSNPIGCNDNTPNWGASLGTVSFHTTNEWTIVGNGITQIWSDAVTATNCQKTTFQAGSTGNFHADCRSNPGFLGDLFSWCAVVRFADQLCPYPWRVPTNEDFRDLDIAMGGTGSPRTDLNFVNENYITRWGGSFGGYSHSGGTLGDQGDWGRYWSQTETSAEGARHSHFGTSGSINPQHSWARTFGFSLRCVR